jgi:Cu/Ag efflux protein CusF
MKTLAGMAAAAGLCIWSALAAADTTGEEGPANPAAATALLEYDSGLARQPASDPPALPWKGGMAAAPAAAHEAHRPQGDTVARVVSVNRRTGEALLEHGPIARLNMPAMTMVFKTADATVLRQLRAGERIVVMVKRDGADLLVTAVSKP